jgi:hypothetical protein
MVEMVHSRNVQQCSTFHRLSLPTNSHAKPVIVWVHLRSVQQCVEAVEEDATRMAGGQWAPAHDLCIRAILRYEACHLAAKPECVWMHWFVQPQ